jgi:hypothetical protein
MARHHVQVFVCDLINDVVISLVKILLDFSDICWPFSLLRLLPSQVPRFRPSRAIRNALRLEFRLNPWPSRHEYLLIANKFGILDADYVRHFFRNRRKKPELQAKLVRRRACQRFNHFGFSCLAAASRAFASSATCSSGCVLVRDSVVKRCRVQFVVKKTFRVRDCSLFSIVDSEYRRTRCK